jgi:hypothetical protein
MQDSERYLELLERVRDTLGELLEASPPGARLEPLQTVYMGLNQGLEAVRAEAQPTALHDDKEWWRKRLAWKAIRGAERDRLLLDTLADDRLTIRELTARLSDALPECSVYESDTRRVVNRLFGVGELDRTAERRAKGNHNGAIRWRYFRFQPELSGSIADLDRAFHDEPTGEEGC